MNTIAKRVHRAMVRWGVLKHSYGRQYAKDKYTVLGGVKTDWRN